MCEHKNCFKKFSDFKSLGNHHDRYNRYCVLQKKEMRKQITQSNKKLSVLRKENVFLKEMLSKNNIDFKEELKQYLKKRKNDENNDEEEQNRILD